MLYRNYKMIHKNNVRSRLAGSASRIISYFKNEETLKLYKGTYAYLEDLSDYQLTYDKDKFQEFTGVFFSIESDELTNLYDSNLYDIKSLHKLYTTSNLEFELKDRISDSNMFYEIVSIDSSIGYLTIILKVIEWK
ncbi:Putative cytosolic protein (plasmid) [Borrelia coriaceae ATCC 43381]|uniref:Putative cytosolic protein n=2 Tax=Borrelia coriaceae TaxID=144 RepID=W5SY87_9SPIR|nr:Putative cytosolic protein [Borrelia coriaceae ATCC 43381]